MSDILHSHIEYIVPFFFETPAQPCFDDVLQQIVSKEPWAICQLNDTKEECDLYATILDAFTVNETRNNIGGCLLYQQGAHDVPLLQFEYTKYDTVFSVLVQDLRLFLFRSGVGFLCYKVVLPKSASVAQAVQFQNEFKELSYARYTRTDRKTGRYLFELSQEPPAPLLMGVWLDAFLAPLPLRYTYFAARENPFVPQHAIPDKALMFNYVVMQGLSKQAFWESTYRLTNGYNERYLVKSDVESQFIEFFHQAYCYTSMGGTGYYVMPEAANRHFYMGIFERKMKKDYFLLYMLGLYQSYTLLKFTQEMESSLSAEADVYLSDSHTVIETLRTLETKINVFLIKSVYASVSHINHQNEYYEYNMQRLHVRENIDGLTIGLGALQMLQQTQKAERLELLERQENKEREMSDDRLSIRLGILSVLAVMSAITDGNTAIEIVAQLLQLSLETQYAMLVGLISTIVVVGVVAIISIWPSIRRLKKENKK